MLAYTSSYQKWLLVVKDDVSNFYNMFFWHSMQTMNSILTETETRQIFFSHVCNGKKIRELFASTLDEIAASVKCVPSIIVVLNAKLT